MDKRSEKAMKIKGRSTVVQENISNKASFRETKRVPLREKEIMVSIAKLIKITCAMEKIVAGFNLT